MERITLKDKTFKLFIPYEDISAAIDDVAKKINADFEGCTDCPVLLCVLNGSIMFMGELMKRLKFDCQIVSTKLTSYEGTCTTGSVKQAMGLTADITGKRVIVIEDIVDTGLTMHGFIQQLKDEGARSVELTSFLFKPDSLQYPDATPKYVGKSIPTKFVLGYGLDFDEKGRNLPSLYTLRK
jgi:hypoxanthine phosphoribosyltransferase